ncbi:MAG TPA: cobalamin-dependent protein, partial [Bryobacteraceae bacterium]|nr:cobalamin-dependent protein [Bryobacteraceae bacterium]
MKVCLVGAPTAHEIDDRAMGEAEALRVIAEHAPLGVLSLAAVLEERGLCPEVVDLNRLYYDFRRKNGKNEHDFSRYAASYFRDRQFDFVGFSSVCSSYPITLRIACEVKRQQPASVVAFGGPQASAVDAATLEAYAPVDLVVRGEAEETLPRLLEVLDQGRVPDDIPGITFRRGG